MHGVIIHDLVELVTVFTKSFLPPGLGQPHRILVIFNVSVLLFNMQQRRRETVFGITRKPRKELASRSLVSRLSELIMPSRNDRERVRQCLVCPRQSSTWHATLSKSQVLTCPSTKRTGLFFVLLLLPRRLPVFLALEEAVEALRMVGFLSALVARAMVAVVVVKFNGAISWQN